MREEGAYLGEGDGDAGVQLNVVGQLCELVLLLLERLQQAADLLLGQHNSAVVLRRGTRRYRSERRRRGGVFERALRFLPVEVFFRSAGRRWTPETAGWSCPPAAASARSASPGRGRPPRSAPSPPADTASRGGRRSKPARRSARSLLCRGPAGRPGSTIAVGSKAKVHVSDPKKVSRVPCAPCRRRPRRSALRPRSAERFPPTCGSTPTPHP